LRVGKEHAQAGEQGSGEQLESVRMHTQESVCKRKRVGKSEREGGGE